MRCLEIPSEASRPLPDDLKQRHGDVPSVRIASAEDVFRHDYDDVTSAFVLKTLRREMDGIARAGSAEWVYEEQTREQYGMAGQGGAGASVSSGAGFQARVAAYALLASICEQETEFGAAGTIALIGFETRTAIDDLNILFRDGSRSYVQAKAVIGFTLNGELGSVLQQFEAQEAEGGLEERYLLVTSSRASKKVAFELRAALNAYRTSPEADFFRDQPKNLLDIVIEMRDKLQELRAAANRPIDPGAAGRILRRSHVLILDVEDGDSLEQAIKLVLQAKDYTSPSGVWGKAISDCVTYAKARRTVAIEAVAEGFQRFRVAAAPLPDDVVEDILKIELGKLQLPAGKEVIFARALDDNLVEAGDVLVMELLRFDEDGNELLDVTAVPFSPSAGLSFEVILRTATIKGMLRLFNERPELIEGKQLGVVELDKDGDPETSPAAQAQRQRLENALRQNLRPLLCVHCGEAVWEPVVRVVEIGDYKHPIVGLLHQRCLKPTDRIVGAAGMPAAEKHPELINFDVNAWFHAAQQGQRTFNNLDTIRTGQIANMLWNGEPKGPLGQYLVEMQLQDGGFEIVTQRNHLHRFSRGEAEEYVASLNLHLQSAREAGDPICYTDESKGFGPRSILIAQFGLREKIREVISARMRPFEQRLVAAFARPGKWYAPLMYLRHRPTDLPCGANGAIFLLTDPMSLRAHLDNWTAAGLPFDDYELMPLLSDEAFDDFMRWVDDRDLIVVVDPVLDPVKREMVSGVVLESIGRFHREHEVAQEA